MFWTLLFWLIWLSGLATWSITAATAVYMVIDPERRKYIGAACKLLTLVINRRQELFKKQEEENTSKEEVKKAQKEFLEKWARGDRPQIIEKQRVVMQPPNKKEL